ncbi:hypothetical protein J2Z84_002645 [Agrobacterium rubi]|nr:hypothetical protein [Agrobacterium rubi]
MILFIPSPHPVGCRWKKAQLKRLFTKFLLFQRKSPCYSAKHEHTFDPHAP